MNLENRDGFKDACELVAEGAGAGVLPSPVELSSSFSLSSFLMALFSSLYDIMVSAGSFPCLTYYIISCYKDLFIASCLLQGIQ